MKKQLATFLAFLMFWSSMMWAQSYQNNWNTQISLSTQWFPGATLDARVSNCFTSLSITGGVCDSSQEPSNCGTGFGATLTLSQSNILWYLPLAGLCEDVATAGKTISVTGNFDTISCKVYHGCPVDASNNGSAGTVNVSGSHDTVERFKVNGGRLNVQTGNEINFDNSTPTMQSDGTIRDLWIINAGSNAINVSNFSTFKIIANTIEKSGSACVGIGAGPNSNLPVWDGLIEDNECYDYVETQAVGIGGININSLGAGNNTGVGATQSIRVINNLLSQGGLGPSVRGTASGGAMGITNSLANGATTVTVQAGDAFQNGTAWTDGSWHIRIAGYDYGISSVVSGTLTFAGGKTFQGCVVTCSSGIPFVVYRAPDMPAGAFCVNGAVGTNGATLTQNSTSFSLTGGSGFSGCVLLSTMTPGNNWRVQLSDGVHTFTELTSTTGTLGSNFTGTSTTTGTFSLYVLPTNSDTGGGEGIQVLTGAQGVQVQGNRLFNVPDEGIVCPVGGCDVVGNYIEDPSQSCNGCGGILQSDPTFTPAGAVVGPTVISGNIVVALSSLGTPSGQANIINSTGTVPYGVWSNVASSAGTPCALQGGSVQGNVFSARGNGAITNGFKATASTACTLKNYVIGPNTYDGVAAPVNINYANFTGTYVGPDIPGIFNTAYGSIAVAIPVSNAIKMWGYQFSQAVTCDKITFTVKTADSAANVYDISILTGGNPVAGGNNLTRVCDVQDTGSGGHFGTTGDYNLVPTNGAGAYIPANTMVYVAVATNCAATCAALGGTAPSGSAGANYTFLQGGTSTTTATAGVIPATVEVPANTYGYGSVPNLGVF